MKGPIVFFGNEKLATGLPVVEKVIQNSLRQAGYQIEAVVTDKTIPAHTSKIAVLAAYGKILPQSVLDQFPLGVINVHPSLLPAYRGPTPIEQAILDGVDKTGVSIMRLTKDMDAGPLYAKKQVTLSGHETKAELATKLQHLGAELLLKVLPGILDGSSQPYAQHHPDRATYSHMLTKADGKIDWRKPAVQLEREVRAFLVWPRSYTTLAGKEVIITAAAVRPNYKLQTINYKLGEAFVLDKKLVIQTGEGLLVIEKLQPAGGKQMTGAAFLAGHHQLLD